MTDLKQQEEWKRLRCADPVLWWTIFQQTIDWIDSQQPVPRASKAGCLRAQRKHDRAANTGPENDERCSPT